ncbi:MAG TPA: GatB/YqeY domain-containing protein [Patescibacteria group bacterium]|nr:GatB/YqeY domain-containing protein [Patescibacteria group bacterium]
MNDMKAALLGGNRFEGEVLRGLKAAILNEEVATNKRDEGLADAEIEKVIAREIKKRRESAKLYRDNGRDDLAEPEEQEAAVLEKYLPEQMGEDEIRTLVQNAIKTLGASGPQAMGQVIGAVKAQAGNSADGATIAAIVKQELQT